MVPVKDSEALPYTTDKEVKLLTLLAPPAADNEENVWRLASTIGTAMGILSANMVPEKRAALMARAYEFG